MLIKLLNKAKKAVVFVTIYAFLFATLPAYAYLPPISNAQMYTLATQGNVRALRAAVQRGLNIDTLDRYGNTALCHAILQRNYTAYNTLRASGANPHHPCVQNLRSGYYDSFLASKRVVPTTANSREAYAYMGEEEFMFSSATWWTLGAILLGGGLIWALSGGGGGGNSGYYFPSYTATDYSLGGIAGTNRPDYPANVPYDPAILLEQNGGTITNGEAPDYNLGGSNYDGWVIANDASIKIDGESQKLTDVVDFNTSVLQYGSYMQAAMKGIFGSTVNNGYAADNPRYDPSKKYLITLGNNATALVALENSWANNYSQININAENGSIGMIASQNSTATNALNGQININYIGSKDNHGVIGMYADTGSTIINNGTIMGQDHSTEASAGTITGMRGQILNQETAPFSKTYAINNGEIELSIAADNREVKTSLVGMGSWLEDEFLNGSMLLSRAGFVYLDNLGSIIMNVSLTGSGTYNATGEDGVSYLMQGIGGIIGMRADGNTIATNGALIDINITDTGDSEKTVSGNAAGMQSVHGGTITNKNTINVTGGVGNFGMLAVRGQGSNTEFNGNANKPILNNQGTINIDSEDGFGMASFNGGASVNTGTINLAKKGTGIQHNTGTIANSGKIKLEQGGVGISMTQKGDITNEANGSIYIDNSLSNPETSGSETTGDGTETSAEESIGILQQNGNVVNNGTITVANTTGAENTISYGIKSIQGNVTSTNKITISDAQDSYAIYAQQGNINNSGEIVVNNSDGALDGIGYGLKAGTGNIQNTGAITISNKSEAYAISTDSGSVDNENSIVISNNTGSGGSVAYGIKGGNGYINNNGTITINNANEGYGIYTANGQITNNADITLTNSQQAQNKTSYGIKADQGSVVNNADIYMNVTGDTTGEVSNDSGSFGIWGGQANITNSANSKIVFSLRGNGMYTESGSNDNYGTIHMQDGGTGMGTASGNATNHTNATITIDDTGVGMSSGIGSAVNDGTINITGTLSTGMESERYAENNNIINVTGYNSKGMSVIADNAQIVNNGQIILSSDHNGMQNYGMYGAAGIYSRMVNNKDILITGREYPSTENIAYGMYLDEGEAKNYGNITMNQMFGYGMYLVTGGTLDNYADITLNYGGVGMGAGGTPEAPATAAMINHAGGNITANGQFSYGMKGEGSATAWNDGNINITGDGSYGIFTTNGSGTNTNSIVMNSSNNTGMHSEAADTINKATGVITINGQNSVGMSTKDGGTSDTSKIGALNEGTINLEAGATSSTGMTVTGSGVATNNNQINVKSTNSSGMWAQGENGTVTNSGIITVTGNESSGMKATAGTATNNKEIIIQADDAYGMFADGDSAEIVNGMNGTIVIDDANNSKYAMYVKNGSGVNEGTLTYSKQGLVAMYVEKGSISNNRTINLSGDGAVAMQGAGENNATLINTAGKSGPLDYEDLPTFSTSQGIIISGENSTGMKAGGNTTATNDINGVITVNGANSYGMVATGVTLGGQNIYGTAINNGVIIVNDASSKAMYADGGEVQNGTSGMIYTTGSTAIWVDSGSGSNLGVIRNDSGNFTAMYVEGGKIDNQGKIVLNGNNSVGMEVNGSAEASNSLSSSRIEVNGTNSSGMLATAGKATNSGIITVNGGTGSVAMQANGGTIVNASGGSLSSSVQNGILMSVNQGKGINQGQISSDTTGLTAMFAQAGAIVNDSTGEISLSGDNAVGMNVVTGTAQNNGSISVDGSGAIAMEASGSGTATNAGKIEVTSTDGYAMYADNGGSIVNSSTGTISTEGSSAMYAKSGNATNEGSILNDTADFHAIHVVNGSAKNSAGDDKNGAITLGGIGAVGIYAETATVENSGAITMNGASDTFAIQVTGTGTVTNSGTITVNATSSGTGIALASGSASNSGSISVTGAASVGMTTETGSLTNELGKSISANGQGSIGMQVLDNGQATNYGSLEVDGTDAIGMYGAAGSTINNRGTITMEGSNIVGMEVSGSGATATNYGNINLTGNNIIGMKATSGATIDNQGTIIYSGTTSGNKGTDNIFYVDSSSTLLNEGTITNSAANSTLSLFRTSRILVGDGGNFTAAVTEGNLGVDVSDVDGSEKIFKNAVTTGNADNLNVYASAWLQASLVESEDEVDLSYLDDIQGNSDDTENANSNTEQNTIKAEDLTNYDIVVKKLRLNTVLADNVGIEDRSVLDKLDDAYEAGAQSQVFDAMKTAYTNDELNTTIKKELGLDFFANFAKQNLDVIKSADRQINTAVFNNRSDKEVRFMTGYDFMSRSQKATAYLADYEDQAHSVFGMLDRKFNDHFRYGIGAIMSSLNSEYDGDISSRDEVMFQVLFPLSAQFENTKIVSVPRIGMGFGEYTRRTMSGKYEADTTNYYYGITNEARHNIDMGWFGLEPTLEFNVLGIHQSKIKENGALEVDASDSLSVEAGAGLYATKLFEFGENHALKLRAGGTIYHELADPYKAQSARLRDAGINYNINSYDADRTRGILSLRVDYNYNKFNFYSEFNKYLESDDAYAINAGMGYKF